MRQYTWGKTRIPGKPDLGPPSDGSMHVMGHNISLKTAHGRLFTRDASQAVVETHPRQTWLSPTPQWQVETR